MDFRLTEEQELIRKNMREFAERHVDPIAAEIDENSRHPVELFRKLGEGGWMGIPLPQQYGGAGADFLTHVVAVEEISRSCSSTGFTLSFHAGIIGMSLFLFGNDEQKKKYLVPLARGQHLGSFALTEPGAGTDVMAVAATAVHQGNSYVVNGTKTFVSNGPIADTYIFYRPQGNLRVEARRAFPENGAPSVSNIGSGLQGLSGPGGKSARTGRRGSCYRHDGIRPWQAWDCRAGHRNPSGGFR
jgi:alkylation response protein AidB-like acyl-CoA dehydrogenase